MPVCQTAYFGLVKPPAEETRCFCSDPARTFIACIWMKVGGRCGSLSPALFLGLGSRQQIEQEGCLTSCWHNSIASKMAFELASPINSLLPSDPLYSSAPISPSYPLGIYHTHPRGIRCENYWCHLLEWTVALSGFDTEGPEGLIVSWGAFPKSSDACYRHTLAILQLCFHPKLCIKLMRKIGISHKTFANKASSEF